MATTEGLADVTLAPGQAGAALPLSVEAGWNQLLPDWRFMLEAGTAFGVADGAGRLGASALVLPLGPRLCWISMVLVTQSWRRLGLGTRLLRRCLDEVAGRGAAAGLDATELGRPVYLPLGFRDLYRLSRFRLEATPAAPSPPAGVMLRPLAASDLAALASWDAARSAMARQDVLAHLHGRQPGLAWIAERAGAPAGFVLGREGRLATQIGPLVADDPETALALAGRALAAAPPPYFLDVPDAQTRFCSWLAAHGAVAPRYFIRMVLGDMPGLERTDWIYAIGGPELG